MKKIEWKEPPSRGTHLVGKGKLQVLVAGLKKRPGAWAVAGRYSITSGTSSGVRLRRLGCEVTQRTEGSYIVLYARWPEPAGNGHAAALEQPQA